MTQSLILDVQLVQQPIGAFYSGVVEARSLLDICKFDYRRIQERGGYKDFLGIQRKLSDDRVTAIRKYIGTMEAVFPTSIVISVDERCASFETLEGRQRLVLQPYQDPENDQIRIEYGDIATIIDGQHRLKAFEGLSLDFSLSVSIFVGIDDALEASIFSTVNLAQTKVNKSLVYDLFALDRSRSPEKTCHELVIALDQIAESPFRGRIKRLGSATEGRFGETLSQATVVKGILPYITRDPLLDRDLGKRVGFWPERGVEDVEKRIFYPFFQRKEDEKILAILMAFFSSSAGALARGLGEHWERSNSKQN